MPNPWLRPGRGWGSPLPPSTRPSLPTGATWADGPEARPLAVWFTSDTHFADHRVLNLYPRPFASVAEMDAELVARWNAVVDPGDEVWHLGDFARTARAAAALLPELNGAKHLILGNNDPPAVASLGWASVAAYAEITSDGTALVLCHYPFRSWNGMHRGAVNLHGHSHGRLKPLNRQFDVGVDARDYRPVSLGALLARKAAPALVGSDAPSKARDKCGRPG